MPIYEYVCQQCGQHTETIQKVSDPPLAECDSCNGKLEKVMSRTSFQLKGGGWYKDGYSNQTSKQPDKKETKANETTKKTTSSESKTKTTKAD